MRQADGGEGRRKRRRRVEIDVQASAGEPLSAYKT